MNYERTRRFTKLYLHPWKLNYTSIYGNKISGEKKECILYMFLGVAQIRTNAGALGSSALASPQTIRGRPLQLFACICIRFSWSS